MKTKRKKGVVTGTGSLQKALTDRQTHAADLEQVKTLLARQITLMRGDRSQTSFGKLIGKPQSVVSRLEDPSYGKVTLQTLLDIASALDVSLVVRFASHDAYRKLMQDTPLDVLQPHRQPNKKEVSRLRLKPSQSGSRNRLPTNCG